MRSRGTLWDIAPLTAAEIDSLDELPWPGTPAWPRAAWAAYKADAPVGAATRRVVLGSRTTEGTLTGWIAGTQVLASAELEHMVVDPRWRGRGVGRQLLQAWLRWCLDGSASDAWLEVRAGNVAALGLYRAEGFAESGRRDRYYSDPIEDAVVMRSQCVVSRPPEGAMGTEIA